MIVTIVQAKDRYCGPGMGSPDGNRCIADQCMAWRWAGIRGDGGTLFNSDEAKAAAQTGAHETNEQPVGYCGMAGKP